MAEKIDHVAKSVDTMSKTLVDVRDAQLHQTHTINHLKEKLSEIEPIVINLKEARDSAKHYSKGMLFGVSLASGAVGAGIHNLKALAAFLASILTP